MTSTGCSPCMVAMDLAERGCAAECQKNGLDVAAVAVHVQMEGVAEDNEGLARAHPDPSEPSRSFLHGGAGRLLRVVGPGLLACLADTDSGCLIVASQSGARWGYSLLLLQVLLIPVLFMAQELTVRLGIYTGKGHTACIRQHYGPCWAWFSVVPLVFQCVCTMVSEMSGVAAVGELWGLGRLAATLVAAAIVLLVVLCCRYRQIEIIGVTLGLFELAFVVTMFCYHPSPAEVFRGAVDYPADKDFMSLIAANIGAVIMPWMIYFQQSAVVARGLTTAEHLKEERIHTFIGSALTQLVMIGALVTLAAATEVRKDLETVEEIVTALEPALGDTAARVFVSLAFVGGSLCAAFVVSLAASWALCEVTGSADGLALSLNVPIRKAKLFYASFVLVVAVGVVVLLLGVDIVQLSLAVVLLDALLMPFTVGFLFFLAAGPALPEEARVKGWRKVVLGTVFCICSIVCVGSAIYGLVPSVPGSRARTV